MESITRIQLAWIIRELEDALERNELMLEDNDCSMELKQIANLRIGQLESVVPKLKSTLNNQSKRIRIEL